MMAFGSLTDALTSTAGLKQKNGPSGQPRCPDYNVQLSLVNQIRGAPIAVGCEPCKRRGMLLGITKKFIGKQFVESKKSFVKMNALIIVSFSLLMYPIARLVRHDIGPA